MAKDVKPARALDVDRLHQLIDKEIEKVERANGRLDEAIDANEAKDAREWQLTAMRGAESISKYVHAIAKYEGPAQGPGAINLSGFVAFVQGLEQRGVIARGSINRELLEAAKPVEGSASDASANGGEERARPERPPKA